METTTRRYSTKDVDFLITSDTIINSAIANQPFLETKRSNWRPAFFQDIKTQINNPDPNHYSTTSAITGELKITYHNYNQAILSGTFWFDAINSNGEIVHVREGRFDMHY